MTFVRMVRALASSLEVDMKTLLIALAAAAALTAPLAASAHEFGGTHGGGFGVRATPAFHGVGRVGFAPRPFVRGFDGPRFAVGAFVPALYWNAYLSDPFDYGLAAAPWGCHWITVGDEALLIQDGTGAVVQAVPL